MSFGAQLFGVMSALIVGLSAYHWKSSPTASLAPTTARNEIWRTIADELGVQSGPLDIKGTLQGVNVHVHAGDGEYWIEVDPEARVLYDMQFTTHRSVGSGNRIATGDLAFDRRFKTTGSARAVFSVLGAQTRLHLVTAKGPISLKGGALRTRVLTTAVVSSAMVIARLNAMVQLAKDIVPADPDEALLRNMVNDPSDDLRFGAFDAAIADSSLCEAAVARAAQSRWPQLRLRASDAMSGADATTLLATLLESSASSSIRCEAIRRAHTRPDVDAQKLVVLALATDDMAVVRLVRELNLDVSRCLDVVRRALDNAQGEPSELVLLLSPHAELDDCALLLRTLERHPVAAASIAALLAELGGPNEAQHMNTMAGNTEIADSARSALRAAAKQIAARAAVQGGVGRLGIASPVRAGAMALAQDQDAGSTELSGDYVENEAQAEDGGSS